jgi:hypothetical protein
MVQKGRAMPSTGINSEQSGSSNLGQKYLLTSEDTLSQLGGAHPAHFRTLFGGGAHTSPSPTSTLVGSSDGLEINLVWDPSVRGSSNWKAIESSVVSAAEIYTQTFIGQAVVNIRVGYGEVGGQRMSRFALGESETNGYITDYTTATNALGAADAGLVSRGLMSADALTSNAPPTDANYFVPSAEAKVLGLTDSSSAGIDGYIGIGKSSVYFPTSGSSIGSSQYDGIGIAAHEISEVMGRIGLEGSSLGTYNDVYSLLDLYRYEGPNVRDLTSSSGYFSLVDGADGATNLNTFNDGTNGGDSGDWASSVLNDAYDAFGTPGVMTHVSPTDLLEVASLGYGIAGLPTGDFIA